jgi:hypothetical protein
VNRFLAETFIEGTDEITVTGGAPDWAVRESDRGVLVGVNGTLRTADTETPTNSTGTQAPYLDARFDAWYELTPSRARRTTVTDLTRDQSVPDFEDAEVVACAE